MNITDSLNLVSNIYEELPDKPILIDDSKKNTANNSSIKNLANLVESLHLKIDTITEIQTQMSICIKDIEKKLQEFE